MLASALILVGIAGSPQEGGRIPIPTPESAARELPLEELLAKVPHDAWGPHPNRWTLSAETLELRRRAESGELTDDEWRIALIAADTIHTRKRWPAGEPLVLWVDQQAWLRSTEIRVRAIEPELGGVSANNLTPSRCGNCSESRRWRNRDLRLAALPDGTSQILFEVTILQADDLDGRNRKRLSTRQLWCGYLRLPVQAVSTVEEALPSTRDGLDAIQNALRAGRSTAEDSRGEPYFTLGGTYAEFPMLEHTGIALTLELWHSGRMMGSTDLVAGPGSAFSFPRMDFSGYGMIEGLAETIAGPDVDLSTWEVRVRGNPGQALSIWEADRWWSGGFTLPLSVAMSRD